MSECLTLPFFSREGNSITYLGYPYADTEGLAEGSSFERQYLESEGICIPLREQPVLDGPTVEKIMVIEPHPDDFALSAAGYVFNRMASANVSCQVVNIFSRTSVDRFPWHDRISLSEERLEQLRLQESVIAVQDYLGGSFESLRLPLASLRGDAEVFAERHNEADLVKHVGRLIVEKAEQGSVTTILLPLAVQGHIDHLVAHDAAMLACEELGGQVRQIIYEDYPYARNKQAYNERLRKVQAVRSMEPFYIDVEDHLADMANLAIIYRSQFDDVNRDQMYAIMAEDSRAVAAEARSSGVDVNSEFAQRFWRVA